MKSSNQIFIHATNVHQGGGQSLLNALLKSFKREFVLLVDERMPLLDGATNSAQVIVVKPSVLHRLYAEILLYKSVDKEDVVLCFGNLPPLFKLRGNAVVFVQNRYLIEDVALSGFPVKVRLRLSIERLWLTKRMMNVDEFIVQTPTMKRLLEILTRGKVSVRILPFSAEPSGYVRQLSQLKFHENFIYDFVYVASGEPHKNHQKLLEAWCLLAKEGLFPSLCLTLDGAQFPDLCRLVESIRKKYYVKIINVGGLTHNDVLALYKKSRAAIYPSIFESFGLPLIEARQANLPILASELDFVRDVIDPEQSFNPESPLSISRAVKRFMDVVEQPLPLLDASQFLASVFKKDI